MKIPKERVSYAYDISKQVYLKQLTFSEGRKLIIGNEQINKNSAADYIHDFRCLVDSNRFTRTLNAFSMEYFLKRIFEDYGIQGLTNALTALKEHIEYYESLQKVKMHKMRAIYEKYSAAIPIQSADEQEQNEIIQEIVKTQLSKDNILIELLNIRETEPATFLFKGKAFKRDNKTIAQIKILRGFRCQFCGVAIRKKDGNNYIEAAHIIAKHLKGRETLDNIILLCPNHHKEFDLGDTVILNPSKSSVDIILNGKNYHIDFETAGIVNENKPFIEPNEI